jgi:hypothetical protein
MAFHRVRDTGSNKIGNIRPAGAANRRRVEVEASVPSISNARVTTVNTNAELVMVFTATAPRECPSMRSKWRPQRGQFSTIANIPHF